jgi:hypothetical protein
MFWPFTYSVVVSLVLLSIEIYGQTQLPSTFISNLGCTDCEALQFTCANNGFINSISVCTSTTGHVMAIMVQCTGGEVSNLLGHNDRECEVGVIARGEGFQSVWYEVDGLMKNITFSTDRVDEVHTPQLQVFSSPDGFPMSGLVSVKDISGKFAIGPYFQKKEVNLTRSRRLFKRFFWLLIQLIVQVVTTAVSIGLDAYAQKMENEANRIMKETIDKIPVPPPPDAARDQKQYNDNMVVVNGVCSDLLNLPRVSGVDIDPAFGCAGGYDLPENLQPTSEADTKALMDSNRQRKAYIDKVANAQK